MDVNKLLGQRIKELRNANGFTIEQAATKVGVSMEKYAGVESGVCCVSLDVLSKAAGAFGVTVGDITMVIESPTAKPSHGAAKIVNMLELFYANKHLYSRLRHSDKQ